jgi:hypothetical protein
MFKIVNLEFSFAYFETFYTQITLSSNGYVCLGSNTRCDNKQRPSPCDILVGLNYDLDPSRNGSGQIYYKSLSIDSIEYISAKVYLNLLNPDLEPTNIFMVTYDEILPVNSLLNSRVSFQIYLLSFASISKSFVIFKFNSCPNSDTLLSSSGINFKNNASALQEVIIINGQQCTSSNVNQTGVWVTETTSYTSGFYLNSNLRNFRNPKNQILQVLLRSF